MGPQAFHLNIALIHKPSPSYYIDQVITEIKGKYFVTVSLSIPIRKQPSHNQPDKTKEYDAG
jgi:hypothetical protein